MADAGRVTLSGIFQQVSTGSLAAFTLDETTDAVEVIFQVREDATITRLGLRVGVITGTTPTYRISLQGVDASGNPDGTILGGGSPASATFSPSGLGWSNGEWRWVNLANSIAVTRGQHLAYVIDYSSGTIDASNKCSFTHHISSPTNRFPYSIQNNAGSRSRQSTGSPLFGYGSSGTAYGNPASASSTLAFHSGSATDEWAVKFTVPAGWCDTYKLLGVRFVASMTASGSTVVALYSGSDTTAANSTGATSETTVQQNVTRDHDFVATTSNAQHVVFFDESTLATLYAGATYRIGFAPQDTNTITFNYQDVAAAADWEANWMGQNIGASSRADGGSNTWTDLTTRRLAVDFILDDITEPASGGGGLKIVGRGGLVG